MLAEASAWCGRRYCQAWAEVRRSRLNCVGFIAVMKLRPEVAALPVLAGTITLKIQQTQQDETAVLLHLLLHCQWLRSHNLVVMALVHHFSSRSAAIARHQVQHSAAADKVIYTLYLVADVPWTSGAVYIASERAATEKRIAAENAAEKQRLLDLKNNQHLPLVFMDVEIKVRRASDGHCQCHASCILHLHLEVECFAASHHVLARCSCPGLLALDSCHVVH